MKLIAAFLSCVVLAIALTARPVSAAPAVSGVQLASGKDDVKASPDQSTRSKTNPNDGKDNNPTDGNAGKGNDDKPPKDKGNGK